MTQENVATVRRVYELANAGATTETDPAVNPIVELFDPDLVLEENAMFPDAATYEGYAGLARWWTAMREVYEVIGLDPRELTADGDRVVARVPHRLRSRAGVELELDVTHVWTLRDGRVVHLTGFTEGA